MFLLYFVNAFQSSILYNLIPFATSDFETHSLLTVIYIVSNAMSAAVYIPLAKMLDLWGRAEGFLVMICFATLGLILMASGSSLSTFCAAQVSISLQIFPERSHYPAHPLTRTYLLPSLTGLLVHRLRWHDLQRRRDYRRRNQIEEPRTGVRFHLITLHHHRLRGTQSLR